MILSYEEMRKINEVQIEMLRDVTEACKKLNIRYYMVHGSLLGTIRNGCFVLGDDDIDIAFFRKDYELFIEKAPQYLSKNYFIQTNKTDEAYPLEFAKLRDGRTTYVVQSARYLPIHHGVYIDIFPMDNYRERKWIFEKLYSLNLKLLRFRVRSVWYLPNTSVAKKIASLIAKAYCPDVKKAIRKIDRILMSEKESELITVSGGKPKERGIPKIWFEKACDGYFEGVNVWIPCNYDSYLKRIYGDYKNRTLLENKESNEQGVEVNASIVDLTRPYTDYIK